MEQVQRSSLRLADAAASAIAALWANHRAGRLTVAQFEAAAATVVAQANTNAVSLVDLGVTAEVIRQTGRATRPLGLRPTEVQVDRQRLRTALARIIAADVDWPEDAVELAESRAARVTRFGRDETLLTVATTTTTALRTRQPTGWVRRTDPDPCSICRGWADGVVRSVSVPMRRHRGCACIAEPVFGPTSDAPERNRDEARQAVAEANRAEQVRRFDRLESLITGLRT